MWHAGSLSIARPATFSSSQWIKLEKPIQASKQQTHHSEADSFTTCLAPCKTKMYNTSDEHWHFSSEICQFSDFPKCSWNKPPPKKRKDTKPEIPYRIQWNPFCFPVALKAVRDTNGHQLLSSPSVDLPMVPTTCISPWVHLQHSQGGVCTEHLHPALFPFTCPQWLYAVSFIPPAPAQGQGTPQNMWAPQLLWEGHKQHWTAYETASTNSPLSITEHLPVPNNSATR